MSNKGQNTEKETLDKESLNAEETTNTADSQNECNETTSQGESVETVDTLKAELETLKDKYLRTVAEFDNYKKRTLKEKTELILNGSEKTVTTFLPILDDMERAIANAGKSADITAIEEGWELIYNKFIKQLDSIGVKKIETNDADFDVDYHEAVAMVPGMGDDKKGKVIDCVQTGYTLNDKVIRHAKVAVGQ